MTGYCDQCGNTLCICDDDDIGGYEKPRWVDEAVFVAERQRADAAEAQVAELRAADAAREMPNLPGHRDR